MSTGEMPRGERLLWTVPVVIGVQQLIVALPGDDVSGGRLAVFWFLVTVALTWAAAARRSSVAWWVLVTSCVWALAVALVGVAAGYGVAAFIYLVLVGVVFVLLLAPASRAHVSSNA